MNRIKSIRQKNSGGSFNAPIPFGTDGNLVDMASGLNNEQELKLGGNHKVTFSTILIEEDNVEIEHDCITEYYYKNNNNPHTDSDIAYTIRTVFHTDTPQNGDTSIETSLWQGALSGTATKVKTTIIPATGDITEGLS